MADYVEREAAVNICSNQYMECLRKSDWCGDTVAWNIGFGIKALPAADVAPVVHGRWEKGRDGAVCSVCDEFFYAPLFFAEKLQYCPHCGAKMDLNVTGINAWDKDGEAE